VISVHAHACNLLSVDDELMALVSPAHGNGPFHIVVPNEALTGLRVGDRVEFYGNALVFSHRIITLPQAVVWSASLAALPDEAAATALNLLIQLSTSLTTIFAAMPGLAPHALAGIKALTSGVQSANLALVAEGAHRLAGLGPGLTPAGDDFLVGLLAGIYLCESQWSLGLTVDQIADCIRQAAVGRTNHLSAAWLHHATRSEFGEPWHTLAQALQNGQRAAIDQAVQRILATGATSGHAAMVGFVHALTLRPDEPKAHQ
jgi:hypothetical protein